MGMIYAVFSDLHANLAAFEGCWDDLTACIKKEGLELTESFCLGDLCGYGCDPVAVVQKAEERFGNNVICGNHDFGVMSAGIHANTNNIIPLIDPDNPAREEIQLNWVLQRQTLEKETRVWAWYKKIFASDNLTIDRNIGRNCHALFSHTSFTEFILYHLPNRFYLHERVIKHVAAGIQDPSVRFSGPPIAGKVNLMISGHTHVPMLFHSSHEFLDIIPVSFEYGKWIDLSPGIYLVNPGSIGQPRDGDPRPCYLLIETTNVSTRIQFRRPESQYYGALESYEKLFEDDMTWSPPSQYERYMRRLAVKILLNQAKNDRNIRNWLYDQISGVEDETLGANDKKEFLIVELIENMSLNGEITWSADFEDFCNQYLLIDWIQLIKNINNSFLKILSGENQSFRSELDHVYERKRDSGYVVRNSLFR
jgi:diadenosine tetraphosphatase ApaH/serine/threonine PP2A family protein phosphatase